MSTTQNSELPELEPVRGYRAAWTILDTAVMYSGKMVAIDSSLEAQPAANTQGLKVIGAQKVGKVDNTNDGETLHVDTGCFLLLNSSTYPITKGAIGRLCVVEDNETVAGYASEMIAAGIVKDVTSAGVYVDMRPEALALAETMRPVTRVAKTADYTCTAAIAFDGKTFFNVIGAAGAAEITLPTGVPGMRVGVQRGSATAGKDVTIQAATGDAIQASDGFCAASKQIDNTVDAISDILWLRCAATDYWVLDANPNLRDFSSWVKNDA